jgi:hypothetical protein
MFSERYLRYEDRKTATGARITNRERKDEGTMRCFVDVSLPALMGAARRLLLTLFLTVFAAVHNATPVKADTIFYGGFTGSTLSPSWQILQV